MWVAEDRGRFAFGTLVDLRSPSPVRVAAPCPVFGRCGGCQWQHIEYERQLEAKRDILVDALGRIGHLKGAAVSNTVGASRQYGWRAAVDLAFGPTGQTYGSVFMPRADRILSPLRNVPSPPTGSMRVSRALPRRSRPPASGRQGRSGSWPGSTTGSRAT